MLMVPICFGRLGRRRNMTFGISLRLGEEENNSQGNDCESKSKRNREKYP